MTLLLLAGTGEAKQIAEALAKKGVLARASLAGATRVPSPLPLPTDRGGFGGREGFKAYLQDHDISAVLDATHPFAHRISHRTAQVCEEMSLPYCQVLRPPWEPGTEDRWTRVDQEEEAAEHIPQGATVFLATGRQTLERFANLAACRLICRQIDPPDRPFPFPNGEFCIGRPPFTETDEMRLFKELGVDWLIAKNAGGPIPRTKLDAARQLGIGVILINRPPQPDAPRVETVAGALDWVRAL